MFAKIFVVLVLLVIFTSLGNAMFHLVKGHSDDKKMVKALSWRIGLSLALFVLLFVGFALGLITPHAPGF